MKNAAQPDYPVQDAPRYMVAVHDIANPKYELMALKAVDGLRPGETVPLYGYYRSEINGAVTYYTSGTMPFCLREAEAEGGYENEVLLYPFAPATISEINTAEYSGEYVPILTNAAIIPRPEPEGRVIQFTAPTATPTPSFTPLIGKEVQHPASIEYRERQTPGKQLFLFPPTDTKQQA